jgi:hypothetical protein
MNKKPYKFERIDFEDLNIYPGETLTVWMNMARRNEERTAIQVELRIQEDGTPEIFCDKLNGKSFKNWEPLLVAHDQIKEGV